MYLHLKSRDLAESTSATYEDRSANSFQNFLDSAMHMVTELLMSFPEWLC